MKNIKCILSLSLLLNIGLISYNGYQWLPEEDTVDSSQAEVVHLLFFADNLASRCANPVHSLNDSEVIRKALASISTSSDEEVFAMMVSSNIGPLNPSGRNNYAAFKIAYGEEADRMQKMAKWIPWKTLMLGKFLNLEIGHTEQNKRENKLSE